jgi:outer membrane protein OmpA-like peptidoglycan-associated protein
MVNVGVQIPLSPLPPPPPPPEPPKVVEVPDLDHDGVVNDKDQCPDTPAGTKVNEVGCPLPPPKCEAPKPGEPVTLEGCKAGDKLVLQGVTFATNKAELDPNARTILDSVADALNKHPEIKVEIGGHTDSVGSDAHNLKLSERRAEAVRTYLMTKGVAGDRMSTAGYGESQPIDSNDTEDGRAHNRRVELKISGGEG